MHQLNSFPVFETEGTEQQDKKRLLLVSFHFPPDSAIGARRWEKVAKYAAQRGWGLDVITKSENITPAIRERLIKALPSGVRIYHVPFGELAVQRWEQSALELVRKFRVNGNVTGVDTGEVHGAGDTVKEGKTGSEASSFRAKDENKNALEVRKRDSIGVRAASLFNSSLRVLSRGYWASLEYAKYVPWLKAARDLAGNIVTNRNHIAVVSSGPPHMMHEVARQISVDTGLPFVMDMRDPWSLNEQIVEHLNSPVWYKLANWLERKCVERATLVVANTDHARLNLQAKYPVRRADIITSMNGFDDDPLPQSVSSNGDDSLSVRPFVIAHAGTIYLDRDPRALFEAAVQVIDELKLTPAEFRMEFIGPFSETDYPIRSVAAQLGLTEFVFVGGPRPHYDAMVFLQNATMLLTMSGSNMSAIPAKTFECMRFDAWLLALSESGSATAELLSQTSAYVSDPNDVSRISDILKTAILDHQRGVEPVAIAKNRNFSRETQANILLDAIDSRTR